MTATHEEFKPWPKTPRWNRQVVITEKIDGTNAAVGFTPEGVCLFHTAAQQVFKVLLENDEGSKGAQ